jgi:cytochrome c oxidase cbb3-type subunit III
MRAHVAVFSFFGALVLAGCNLSSGYPGHPPARPDEVMDFKSLYSQNCASCHGANGQGGPALDLANPTYQALVDDNSLRKVISTGMPGTQMPAFAQSSNGMLTDAQINAIIAGMRQRWSQPNVFAGATPPPYPQVHTGDAQHGQQTYQARCAVCHTHADGEITNPIYLALVSDQYLRTITIAGSPDIGHPDWRHMSKGGQPATPLSDQEVTDVVTYLASLRNAAPQYAGNAAYPAPATAGR